MLNKDAYWMQKAIEQAQIAFESGEIPVGCVVVANNQIIAKAHNQTQLLKDPTAHAEMIAITSACEYLGAKYLKDCTLYVSLEPCAMCARAMHWGQVERVVFGAFDPSQGFEQYSPSIAPNLEVSAGVLEKQSAELLQKFFQEKRKDSL